MPVVGEDELSGVGTFPVDVTGGAEGRVVAIIWSDDGSANVTVTAPNGETVTQIYQHLNTGGSDSAGLAVFTLNSSDTDVQVSASGADVPCFKMVIMSGVTETGYRLAESGGDDDDTCPTLAGVTLNSIVLAIGHLQDEDGPFGTLSGGANSAAFIQLVDAVHAGGNSAVGVAWSDTVDGSVSPGAWVPPSSGNFVWTSTVEFLEAEEEPPPEPEPEPEPDPTNQGRAFIAVLGG